MVEFIKADKSHRADILDFMNYVFSYAARPHDFKKMIPKIYADDMEPLNVIHYMAVEDGRIKAVLFNHIIEEQVGSEVLKYGLIGNVCVHPYSRGAGYMKQLMKMAMEDSGHDGVDVLVLKGKRQRYGYFGFEHAGGNYQFKITEINISHCMKSVDCSDISFELIADPDAEEVDIAKALYEKRPVHGIRHREEFLHVMHSWEAKFHAVKWQGRMIGYVYDYANLGELVLEDEGQLPAVLKAWFAYSGSKEINLSVPPYDKGRIEYLSNICESMSLSQISMIHILNWEKVLETLLGFKQEFAPLQDGTVEFGIEDQIYQIQVRDGNVRVERVNDEHAGDDVKLKYTQNEVQMCLFGLQNLWNPQAEYLNWLPLPFFIDLPDT